MKRTVFLTVALAGFTYGTAKVNLPPAFREQKQQTFSFIENKGQYADQNYQPRPDVLFGGSNGQLTFHITRKGISYQLYRADKYKEHVYPLTNQKLNEVDQQTIYRTDIQWLNANPNPFVITDETLPGCTNYYLEHCPNGALNVKSYQGITLKHIYANINLHYYEKDGQLKYDYIVAPHADYKQIRMKVEGAKLQLQEDGSIIIETPLGKIVEQAPVVYQKGKQLRAQFSINNNIISFEIENPKPDEELIIDPLIRIWGSYYGGSLSDYGLSCATDLSGNVFLAGWTNGHIGTVIATSGAHQTVYGGGNADVYLAKFSNSGLRQWATYYGGTGMDLGGFCATDASGNVYVTGTTINSSSTVIATSASHQSVTGGSDDAFLVKFNSAGVRQWASFYGSTGTDTGNSCATDASGNIYMSGYTSGGAGTVIATSGSHQGAFGGGSYDAYLVKFNSSGVRQWATYYGDAGIEGGYFCSTDVSGNVYLTGETSSSTSTAIATVGSHQPAFGGSGNSDGYLVKFNSIGQRQWGTYYGGTGTEKAYSCIADASGNVYMTGETSTNTGTVIATPGSQQAAFGGNIDAYLVKFNSSGQRQWGTYYGDAGTDRAYCGLVDAGGNFYVTGETSSNFGTAIASPGSYQSNHGGGGDDVFLAKFNSSGIRQFGTYYGGSGIDGGRSCVSDASGYIYLAGNAISSTGTVIATPGGHQSVYGGGTFDAFLVKFADCVAPSQPSAISGSTSVCAGSAQTYSVVNDPAATSYTWNVPGGWSGSSATNTISVIPSLSGSITVVASNTCTGSPPQTLQVVVNPLPTVSVNSGSICSGESFTISPSGANSYTIQGGNSIVSPVSSMAYTVMGMNTAGCLSANAATSNITVHPNPTLSVNSGSICSGDTFTISPSGAFTYSIQGGSAMVSPTTTATYTVTGMSVAGCMAIASVTSSVTVHPSPTITANSSNTLICSGESVTLTASGATTYTWNMGGSGASVVISPSLSTSFTVSGTNTIGCTNTAFITQNVSLCQGIEVRAIQEQDLVVFPNPTCGKFTIVSTRLIPVFVYNALGQLIYTMEMKEEKMEIDLSEEAKGIYFVKAEAIIKKIVKE